MIKRIFKFWLWNKYIFNMSQNGRDFNKSLKILHTFTENVNQKYKYKNNKISFKYIIHNIFIFKNIFDFRL